MTFDAVWLILVSKRFGVIRIRKRFSSDEDSDKLLEILVDRINKDKKNARINIIASSKKN